MDTEFAEDTNAWHHLTTEDSLEAHHQKIADSEEERSHNYEQRKDTLNYLNEAIQKALTPREYEIFTLMSENMSEMDIAKKLSISQPAISQNLLKIAEKIKSIL